MLIHSYGCGWFITSYGCTLRVPENDQIYFNVCMNAVNQENSMYVMRSSFANSCLSFSYICSLFGFPSVYITQAVFIFDCVPTSNLYFVHHYKIEILRTSK